MTWLFLNPVLMRHHRRTSLADALTDSQLKHRNRATGSEVGDLFEYKIGSADHLLHDRSALIHRCRREWMGNASRFTTRPCARSAHGACFEETSALTLEDGSMTIIDGDAYAASLMERLNRVSKRLISFALDLGTLVSAAQRGPRPDVFWCAY